MATKVIVQDVSALASYAANIQKIKTDLELNSSDLFKVFELVRADIASLIVLTNTQKKTGWILSLKLYNCV